MKTEERVLEVIKRLSKSYPRPGTALNYASPLEILVATILSAQCTDERVNQVTSRLFRKYKNAEDYFSVPPAELEEDIRSTGFYKNKTRAIQGAARMIVEKLGGVVPDSMEKLIGLPGVARKTANVVLGSAFGISSGIVVDTHVLRVSFRLGLTREKNAVKVESDLMKIVPGEDWINFSHRLIYHGRETCTARKPRCAECVLNDICPSAFKV